ncbi:MAG: bifunctional [glutamate--ammonia ligase]-adenylyl-L-tyrosine phosphorylase/[glutamate--ammonia-ligase] adenylyltransferase, partial [Pseudomonadota bacterium]|nr:bifunctional [glutamate--ammonia ligase]-adenylyl-L-tyrosine phosphorylase/[glutamate--ammonia-ligase] adenylyltransferase [Pseudomonadota bacterium]
YSAFESLRNMKSMIAKEVERKGLRRNIKLGPGGIREIEFIGQAFQLIYGGREPALRERGILRVLDYLAASERLPAEAVAGLKDAYDFLRRTENRLQAWSDDQTHDLPEDPQAKARLAFAMGCPQWRDYVEALMRHVRLVTAQFEEVFAAAPAEGMAEAPDFAVLWQDSTAAEAARELLAGRGFDDPDKAWDSLQGLRRSYSNRSLSKTGRERMDRLVPRVLATVAAESAAPAETLDRILRLLEAVARRSVYLALMVERPQVLSQLVKLCGASLWIAKYLARYPLLLDELLDPSSLYAPLDRAGLDAELTRHLERVNPDDVEQVMDALRHFKQTSVLRVAAAEVSGAMPLMVVSDHLTEIAEVLLRRVLDLAWRDLLPRFGRPRGVVDGKVVEPELAIVAYGKLGGIELGYGSDLDLVFLHDSGGEEQQTGGPRQLDNATFFARLTQKIIQLLTTHTPAGTLYEVDTRLRPSGRSGLLVSGLTAFAEYQRHQAWTWEHQALVRARVVAGPPRLAQRFAEVRRAILEQPRDVAALRREVREMRQRMRAELGSARPGCFDLKQDRGGIADIEFMVQYAVLANAHRHPQLLTYTDNIRQLDGLEQAGILSAADAALLRDSYRALRRQVHLLKLQEQEALIPDAELGDLREGVIRIWDRLLEGD